MVLMWSYKKPNKEIKKASEIGIKGHSKRWPSSIATSNGDDCQQFYFLLRYLVFTTLR